MKHCLKLSIIIFLSFLSLSGAAYASNPQETFFQANQAYKSGNYSEALRLYSELAKEGQTSPHIPYNIGNTYFRLGDTGNAIMHYERARISMPRDADLNFNLGYVRDRIRDAIEPPTPPLGTIFFWLDSFSPNEIFIIFAIINFLFFTMLILRMFIKQEWTFIMLIIFLVAWLGAGVSYGVKYYQVASDDRAVILSGEASVLAGPDPKDTELFKLHAGAIVKAEKKEGSWSLIKIQGDKRGWIPDSSIGMIKG
jgi:tetratricopeptide (TPR) repeat protein